MHVDDAAGVEPLDSAFNRFLRFYHGAGGGAAIATVRAESFGFGRRIANNTEIQVAPSGSQAGIQIEKREMRASAIKQYAAENAIAPIIKSIRENLRSAPLNAAAITTMI